MTMILDKYKPNFEMLSSDMAQHLAERMNVDVDGEPLTGSDLLEIAEEAGMDQADVVMTMATDATVVGIATVETLIGRPITRTRPAGAPRSHGPRRSVSVKRSDPRKICYVAPNPKKQGSASWARYELYKVGMTVDEFLAAGGTMGDVKWDADRDFIRFGEVTTTEGE